MVNSVQRSAEILTMLSLGKNRITDICNELGLSKSTAHRLLKALEECGLVFQEPVSRRYFLGPLIMKLSSDPLLSHQNLILCAYQEMKMLRDVSGETVALFIPVGTNRLCLEKMDSNQGIKYVVEKGSVSPIYAGSSGRVILSELPKADLNRLLKNITFEKLAPNTITDPKILLRELEVIRKKGYAVSYSETSDGALSIAAPVRGYHYPVAVGIIGPKYRFSHKLDGLVGTIKNCANQISRKIKAAL